MSRNESCAERIGTEWQSTKEDLETLFKLYHEDTEAYDDDLGNLNEYASGFDYVEAGTFEGQESGYFRYQMSGGGPSDEIRFWVGPDFRLHLAEYWFLDWYDGANIEVTQEDVVRDLWAWLEDLAPGIMREIN